MSTALKGLCLDVIMLSHLKHVKCQPQRQAGAQRTHFSLSLIFAYCLAHLQYSKMVF